MIRVSHGGRRAVVEREIAELVLLVWKLGISTDDAKVYDDRVSIGFADGEEAELFVTAILGDAGPTAGLYARVMREPRGVPDGELETFYYEKAWHYGVVPLNVHKVGKNDKQYYAPRLSLMVFVNFPRNDLNEVEERLRERLKNISGRDPRQRQ